MRAPRPRGSGNAYDRSIDYLRASACIDCGETDIRVLQFDHVDPMNKTGNIADLAKVVTWDVLVIEIAKCVVRCGNCHRRKTVRERARARDAHCSIAEARGCFGDAPWRILSRGPLAQWIEREPSKFECAGSSPARPAVRAP